MLKKLYLLVLTFFIVLNLAFSKDNSSPLYYGRVENIIKDEKENISSITMNSEAHGKFIFKISDKTFWIDNGKKSISSKDLKLDEPLYISYPNFITASIPPQSQALVIYKNTPQDMKCGQYYIVKNIISEKNKIKIITENEKVVINIDKKTILSPYKNRKIIKLKDIKEGSKIVVYSKYTNQSKDIYATHLILLEN